MQLDIVVASTRPGRAGSVIAKWFFEVAKEHAAFQTKLVELADVGLPLLDEPEHPRLGNYKNPHTKAWSELVSAADAFVFVTPEYNFSSPPALLNAIDYLFAEWAYKPVGFVSYGGASGGMRSVQMTKLLVTSLRMMPIPQGVALHYFKQQFNDGKFEGDEKQVKAARGMLDELERWAGALTPLRRPAE